MIQVITKATGGSSGPAGEVLFTADVVDTRNTPDVGFVSVLSIPYAVNPLVVDGRSRRVRYVCDYSKDNGAGTINFQFIVGGVTLTFTTFSAGVGSISNETLFFDVTMNFRTSDEVHVVAQLRRNTATGAITTQTQKTVALGTWDKAIPNVVDFQWQLVTAAGDHTVTIQQVTSELV